jgi:TatA/E family protein of Tat protein translocase
MGSFSIWHWLIVLAVVLLLFGGGGKIPKLMKDMGTGINAFKKGLKEEKGAAEAKDAETARWSKRSIPPARSIRPCSRRAKRTLSRRRISISRRIRPRWPLPKSPRPPRLHP